MGGHVLSNSYTHGAGLPFFWAPAALFPRPRARAVPFQPLRLHHGRRCPGTRPFLCSTRTGLPPPREGPPRDLRSRAQPAPAPRPADARPSGAADRTRLSATAGRGAAPRNPNHHGLGTDSRLRGTEASASSGLPGHDQSGTRQTPRLHSERFLRRCPPWKVLELPEQQRRAPGGLSPGAAPRAAAAAAGPRARRAGAGSGHGVPRPPRQAPGGGNFGGRPRTSPARALRSSLPLRAAPPPPSRPPDGRDCPDTTGAGLYPISISARRSRGRRRRRRGSRAQAPRAQAQTQTPRPAPPRRESARRGGAELSSPAGFPTVRPRGPRRAAAPQEDVRRGGRKTAAGPATGRPRPPRKARPVAL